MRTAAELQQAVRFILYELWMFRSCSPFLYPDTQIVENLRIEGLVLHARALRDFFYVRPLGPRHPNDVVATDFFPNGDQEWSFSQRDYPAYIAANPERMNRALAHISYDRIGWVATGEGWDHQKLFDELGEMWFKFLHLLEQHNPQALAWFKSHELADRVRFVRPFDDRRLEDYAPPSSILEGAGPLVPEWC